MLSGLLYFTHYYGVFWPLHILIILRPVYTTQLVAWTLLYVAKYMYYRVNGVACDFSKQVNRRVLHATKFMILIGLYIEWLRYESCIFPTKSLGFSNAQTEHRIFHKAVAVMRKIVWRNYSSRSSTSTSIVERHMILEFVGFRCKN
jgi:hypothetical protein